MTIHCTHLANTCKRVLAFVLCSLSSVVHAVFILDFDSAPRSWVGQGQSISVSQADGYLFSVNQSVFFDNSQHIRVASPNSPFGPLWNPGSGDEYHYWTLDLSAPNRQVLSVGMYDNAARWPFQDVSQAGLSFSGDHRGNNRNSGFFEILEVGFDALGVLTTLAVDFTQYGETNPEWWIHGSLRFNSNVPLRIFAPGGLWLIIIGLGVLAIVSKNARQTQRRRLVLCPCTGSP